MTVWKMTKMIGNRLYGDVSVRVVDEERDADVAPVQDCPDGYPRLAAFLDSDDNFMIYRRFGYLQSRLLLEKQEHLRQLEEELENLDEEDREAESRNLITMENYDTEQYKQRRELMQRIGCQFREYGMRMERLDRHFICRVDPSKQLLFFRLLKRSPTVIVRLSANIKVSRTS